MFYHCATSTSHKQFLLYSIFWPRACSSGGTWTLDFGMVRQLFYLCATIAGHKQILIFFLFIFSFGICSSSRTWTLDLVIIGQVFYHCATIAGHKQILHCFLWFSLSVLAAVVGIKPDLDFMSLCSTTVLPPLVTNSSYFIPFFGPLLAAVLGLEP
jgi:hypothetical protein